MFLLNNSYNNSYYRSLFFNLLFLKCVLIFHICSFHIPASQLINDSDHTELIFLQINTFSKAKLWQHCQSWFRVLFKNKTCLFSCLPCCHIIWKLKITFVMTQYFVIWQSKKITAGKVWLVKTNLNKFMTAELSKDFWLLITQALEPCKLVHENGLKSWFSWTKIIVFNLGLAASFPHWQAQGSPVTYTQEVTPYISLQSCNTEPSEPFMVFSDASNFWYRHPCIACCVDSVQKVFIA